ncbi:isopropylmalate isomerase [Altererythrobacter sp. C41]|uniref:isopropylmalate isomerase n=1 Tax=Altererythrobacter sp. C41 TaxID=2806021 RepID=UPI001933FEE1|nr:isopropylmalate isomerase [Altererythrobacter sp. C41]MBM0169948.1 isopropylmalate isomerase [Altererythrobacter sp. C41]
MTKKLPSSLGGKAALAGAAIGSAAIAAAMLYASKRKPKNAPTQPGPIPSGEKPETD